MCKCTYTQMSNDIVTWETYIIDALVIHDRVVNEFKSKPSAGNEQLSGDNLRPVYTCDFSCDFVNKTCHSLPCTSL